MGGRGGHTWHSVMPPAAASASWSPLDEHGASKCPAVHVVSARIKLLQNEVWMQLVKLVCKYKYKYKIYL